MFNIEQFHYDLDEGLNELVKIQIEMNTCSTKCAADTANCCDATPRSTAPTRVLYDMLIKYMNED